MRFCPRVLQSTHIHTHTYRTQHGCRENKNKLQQANAHTHTNSHSTSYVYLYMNDVLSSLDLRMRGWWCLHLSRSRFTRCLDLVRGAFQFTFTHITHNRVARFGSFVYCVVSVCVCCVVSVCAYIAYICIVFSIRKTITNIAPSTPSVQVRHTSFWLRHRTDKVQAPETRTTDSRSNTCSNRKPPNALPRTPPFAHTPH